MASPIHGAAGMPTRKRRCPRCSHVQAVVLMLVNEKVVCRRCGAIIPPDRSAAQSPTRAKRR